MPPERKEYELTEEQYERLFEASQPAPYLIFGGKGPAGPQDRANAAWCELGEEIGFDGMSILPVPGDSRHFTAIPTSAEE